MPKVPVYSFEGRQGNHASSLLNLGTEADRIRSSVVQTENTVPKQTGDLAKSLLENGTVLTKIATDMKNQRDTAYAKDLVNKYTEEANKVTSKYLTTQKKDALNGYNSTVENLQTLRDDLSSKAENDMVSMLFEQNSQPIYSTLHNRVLSHSAQEGNKYNVATQKSYTNNMVELAKKSIDSRDDPNGDFHKYLEATKQSIYQEASLQGIDKGDPIVDNMVRKEVTSVYSSVLTTLLNNEELGEGREIIKHLEKNDIVSFDDIQKFEASYNKAVFTKNVAYLEDVGRKIAFDGKDVLGENGPADVINVDTVTRAINDLPRFSKDEKRAGLKHVLNSIIASNQNASLINKQAEETLRNIASNHKGNKSSFKAPAEVLKHVPEAKAKKIIMGAPEASALDVVFHVEKNLEHLTLDALELYRDYLSEKDYKKYASRIIALDKGHAKAKYKLDKLLLENVLRDFGLPTIAKKGSASSNRKYSWIQNQVIDTLTHQRRMQKKELTREEERRVMEDVLKYTVTEPVSFFGHLNPFSSPTVKNAFQNIGSFKTEDVAVLYTGETVGKYRKGSYITLNNIDGAAIAYYHSVIVQEGKVDPTLRNILARFGEDLSKLTKEQKDKIKKDKANGK